MTLQYRNDSFAVTASSHFAPMAASSKKPNYVNAKIYGVAKRVHTDAVVRIIEGFSDRIFNNLADKLLQETAYLSSPSAIMRTQPFLKITKMGDIATTKILRRLARGEVKLAWILCLRVLTGENPVPPDSVGIIREMGNCWISWGRQRGLI